MHPQIRSYYRCSCGVKKFDPMSNGKSPIYRWTPYIFSKKKVQTIIPRSILVGLIQNLRWKVETMVLYGFCTGKPGLPSDSAQIRHVTSSSGAKVSVLVCLAACRRVGTPKFHRRGSIPWSCKSPRSSMIILDPWWSPKIFPTYLQLWSRIPWPSSAYHAQDNRRPGPPPASKPDRPRWTQGQWSLFSQKWVGYVIDNLYNQSYLHTVILYIYIYIIYYIIYRMGPR